jgi:hypothetical protein
MKNLFFLLLLAIFGCTCHESEFPLQQEDFVPPLRVVEHGVPSANFAAFFFQFNKALDPKSLKAGISFYVDGNKVNYTGEYQLLKENTLIIPACAFWEKTLTKTGTNFSLVLNGDKSSPFALRGKDGSLLDGDNNKIAGGNFVKGVEGFQHNDKFCGLAQAAPKASVDTMQIYRINKNGNSYLYISIGFDMAIDTSSMAYGKSLWVNMSNKSGQVLRTMPFLAGTWKSAGYSGRYRRYVLAFILNSDEAAMNFTVNIKGTGRSVVKSIYGVTLDGDGNGSAGGDYVMSMK